MEIKEIEIWKDIQGYEGLYQVSSLGRIKSLNRYKQAKNDSISSFKERIKKLQLSYKGYLMVTLSRNKERKTFFVHRLVALAFLPNTENKPHIDHIDTNKQNNNVNNLRWVTPAENNNNSLTKEKLKNFRDKMKSGDYSRSKIVLQYSLSGDFIKEWTNITTIHKEMNYNPSCISECCNNKQKTAYGFLWKFKDKTIKTVA